MLRKAPPPLAGSTAVVTGAGSGIGRGLAQRLSAHGCPVAIVDANADTLAETAGLIEGPSLVRTLDVRDRQGLLALAAEVREWAPRPIGAVFNNAGVALSSSVAGASPEDDEWLLSINFDGVVHGVRAFLPVLLEQGSGAIVNLASMFGLVASSPLNQASYCASKGGVVNLTRQLGAEWARRGVRVNALAPGFFPSDMTTGIYEDEKAMKWVRRNAPLGRPGDVSELDGALLLLASDAGSYIVGQTISVDGGWTVV